MRELTQTNLDPGNCWQTCVACILDLDPEVLPSQVEHDYKKEIAEDGSTRRTGKSYATALNAYLRKHHGLAWLQIHITLETLGGCIAPVGYGADGLHMITGRTVRTAASGSRHVVVARRGEIVWDPHPSRAGLLEEADGGEREWGFIIPFPRAWTRFDNEPCVCPACASG